jgi:hypothetical protein
MVCVTHNVLFAPSAGSIFRLDGLQARTDKVRWRPTGRVGDAYSQTDFRHFGKGTDLDCTC